MNVCWITTDAMEMLLVATPSEVTHATVMKVLLVMAKTAMFQILVRPTTATIMQNVSQHLLLSSNVSAKKDSGAMVSLAMIVMNVLNMKTIDVMHWQPVKILLVRSSVIVKMVSKVMESSVMTLMNVKLANIIVLLTVHSVLIHLVHINANVKLVSRVTEKYALTSMSVITCNTNVIHSQLVLTLMVVIHVIVQKVIMVTVSLVLISTNVPPENTIVIQMPHAPIHQVPLNAHVTMVTLVMVPDVLKINVNLSRTLPVLRIQLVFQKITNLFIVLVPKVIKAMDMQNALMLMNVNLI